ncbi:MAG: metabolite traffic protein EboE [Verrucomicrobiota bacterium]|nr:metabolite traffic protein EboE [Verrucomicrobiota bacterium]
MRIAERPDIHLTYCLNVHPGETWAHNFAAVREKAAAVKARVSPGAPFGLGLRLSHTAAAELVQDRRLAEFKEFLSANGLYALTVNGFPFGRFHGAPVKEDVYRPDWTASERRDYTLRLVGILAELLPDGVQGSISTIPCSHRNRIRSDRDLASAIRHLADCARRLADIRERTGRVISLALEPEPDCFLETTAECIAFFDEHILTAGLEHLRRAAGYSIAWAEAVLRTHLGICLDACHLALQFETPADSLRALRRNGLRVSKVQLSSALEARVNEPALRALARFVDPVYLHQTRLRLADGAVVRYPDLTPAALAGMAGHGGALLRCHLHLPLYFPGAGSIGATASDLDARFFTAAVEAEVAQFEIETYTFDILPSEFRRLDIVESIAREFEWVLARVFHTPV